MSGTNPNGANNSRERKELGECLICGETRYIQNCHIFPKCFMSGIISMEELHDTGGRNNVRLCPNHHYFYDNFLLEEDEYSKLKSYCKDIFKECVTRIRNIDFCNEEDRKSWVKNCHLFRRKEKIENFILKHKEKYGDWTTE